MSKTRTFLGILVAAALAVLGAPPAVAAPVTECVSRGPGASEGNADSFLTSTRALSGDGNLVAFATSATNLGISFDVGTQIAILDRANGNVVLGSTSSSGAPADRGAGQGALSANGRYLVFASQATNLVAGASAFSNVYLHDLATGQTTLVSVPDSSTGATQSNDDSGIGALIGALSVSDDGSSVLFESNATNLVPGDTNGAADLFVRRIDRAQPGNSRTLRVSVANGTGAQANGASTIGTLTPDAHYVVFTSFATNLVPGSGAATTAVYVRDLVAQTTELVSLKADGSAVQSSALGLSMSDDGRYVAFTASGDGVIPNDANGVADAFVRDRFARTTEIASVLGTEAHVVLNSELAANDGSPFPPVISGDGRYVAFQSSATNLVRDITDLNGHTADVFARDRLLGRVDQVSVNANGTQGANAPTGCCFANGNLAVSTHGRMVAYHSTATNLVAGVTAPGRINVFATDRGSLVVDSDGDALPDDWEQNGVVINGVLQDLRAMGADPLHKDVFIHVDWMVHPPSADAPAGFSYRPGARPGEGDFAMKQVRDAFDLDSKVPNPDGKPGIRLHIDYGPDTIMNPATGETWGTRSRAGVVPFLEANLESTPIDGEQRAGGFTDSGREGVFYYAIFVNRLPNNSDGTVNGSTGVAYGPSIFVVSLGTNGGTKEDQAGTFMHELGHNLGLGHGGGDGVNYKPNYLSVMNYYFQFSGRVHLDGTATFDYSQTALPTLDESALLETAGNGDAERNLTKWFCGSVTQPQTLWTNQQPPGSGLANFSPPALDWNCNTGLTCALPIPFVCTADTAAVSANLNNDFACSDPQFGPGNEDCPTAQRIDNLTKLQSYRDWDILSFGGQGAIGVFGDARPAPVPRADPRAPKEMTPAQRDVIYSAADRARLAASPISAFDVTPHTGKAPLLVHVDGRAASSPNGRIVLWSWDYGDGIKETLLIPDDLHIYLRPGDYTVSLTVTDILGKKSFYPSRARVSVSP